MAQKRLRDRHHDGLRDLFLQFKQTLLFLNSNLHCRKASRHLVISFRSMNRLRKHPPYHLLHHEQRQSNRIYQQRRVCFHPHRRLLADFERRVRVVVQLYRSQLINQMRQRQQSKKIYNHHRTRKTSWLICRVFSEKSIICGFTTRGRRLASSLQVWLASTDSGKTMDVYMKPVHSYTYIYAVLTQNNLYLYQHTTIICLHSISILCTEYLTKKQ